MTCIENLLGAINCRIYKGFGLGWDWSLVYGYGIGYAFGHV